MSNEELWHYPRTRLAEHYVTLIKEAGIERLTIFAPRRMGKTEFLLDDLAPVADKKGLLVVYVSMWANPDEPQTTLIDTLRKTLDHLETDKGIKGIFKSPVTKLKFEGEITHLGKLGAEIELAKKPVIATSSQLSELSMLFERICEKIGKHKMLLMLDEVQHLATSEKFKSLTYALRTILDTQRKHLAVIFTGSSREDLNRMFLDTKAPLYHFSDNLTFPTLGEEFVDHLAKVYKKIRKTDLDVNRAKEIFEEVEGNLYYMSAIVRYMVINGIDNIDEVYDELKRQLRQESGYPDQWVKLSSLAKYVYVAIAEGKELYSKEHLQAIENLPLKPKPSAGAIRRAVQKLIDVHLIQKGGYGEFKILSENFVRFAKSQLKDILP